PARPRSALSALHLQPEVAQARMVVGTAAERPVIFPLAFLDWKIVDAGNAPAHEAVLIEFPVLVTVAAKPVATVVVPLVGETHRDAVLAEGPVFLDQTVVKLAGPFARQKCFDRRTPLKNLRAIAPVAVGRIGLRDASGVARVPGVFGASRFL